MNCTVPLSYKSLDYSFHNRGACFIAPFMRMSVFRFTFRELSVWSLVQPHKLCLNPINGSLISQKELLTMLIYHNTLSQNRTIHAETLDNVDDKKLLLVILRPCSGTINNKKRSRQFTTMTISFSVYRCTMCRRAFRATCRSKTPTGNRRWTKWTDSTRTSSERYTDHYSHL